jgi:hypothetical protein
MRLVFSIVLFLLCPVFLPVYASNQILISGFVDSGRKSALEDYESEERSEDYTFQKYFLRWDELLSQKLGMSLSVQEYDKDYRQSDVLDNKTRSVKSTWAYTIQRDSQKILEADLGLKYQTKRFTDSPVNEYDQIRVMPTIRYDKKDDCRIDFSLGLDDYDYNDAAQKDQRSFLSSFGIKKIVLDKRMRLVGDYKIENTRRHVTERRKIRQDTSGGFDYAFGLGWIEDFSARLGWGQRDTKSEEERDDDFDYTYRQAYLKPSHKIKQGLNATLKYQYFKRAYLGTDLDNKGFLLANRWIYNLLDDSSEKIWVTAGIEHKRVDFVFLAAGDLDKDSLDVQITFQKKKDWEASCGFELDNYRYRDHDQNQKADCFLAGAKKWFRDKTVSLYTDYKFKLTDHRTANTTRYQTIRVGFECRV